MHVLARFHAITAMKLGKTRRSVHYLWRSKKFLYITYTHNVHALSISCCSNALFSFLPDFSVVDVRSTENGVRSSIVCIRSAVLIFFSFAYESERRNHRPITATIRGSVSHWEFWLMDWFTDASGSILGRIQEQDLLFNFLSQFPQSMCKVTSYTGSECINLNQAKINGIINASLVWYWYIQHCLQIHSPLSTRRTVTYERGTV